MGLTRRCIHVGPISEWDQYATPEGPIRRWDLRTAHLFEGNSHPRIIMQMAWICLSLSILRIQSGQWTRRLEETQTLGTAIELARLFRYSGFFHGTSKQPPEYNPFSAVYPRFLAFQVLRPTA